MTRFEQLEPVQAGRGESDRKRGRLAGLVLSAALVLAACGGASSGDNTPADKPQSATDAQRFLTQATFGPNQAGIDRLNQLGYSRWIDEQLAMNPQQNLVAFVDARDAELKAVNASDKARTNEVLEGFYTRAISDPAQLKLRVAFALSEIFVVSTQDSTLGDNGRLVASYFDMLTTQSTGNYRALLEAVALHPAMGVYLSSLHNLKEDAATGRVPDENFAREVMQLFSIGLYQLNSDGTLKTSGGKPIETYTGDDIKGLAKVFTGWSWYASDSLVSTNTGSNTIWKCFYQSTGCVDPDAYIRPMRAYQTYHSTAVKSFLGTSTNADITGDLKKALDTLAAHPNVAPFISRQLIQRLVTSNPSPAYVARIASVFGSSGGNLRSVVKAILLDSEARSADGLSDPTFGKLREPVLRLTALLRAFKHSSDSMTGLSTGAGRVRYYDIRSTDDAGTSLGQSPLRSPSVFNFYRPGYVPPQSQTAAAGLVAPEMQIVSETSIGGWVNYAKSAVSSGVGTWNQYDSNGDGVIDSVWRQDVQFDFTSEKALADKPGDLVDALAAKLMAGRVSSTLRSQIVTALGTITISSSSPDTGRLRRVQAALFLLLISPDFVVQK